MDKLFRCYRSDAWDSGNYLTRFYECYYECDECNGDGKYDNGEEIVVCDMCNGKGKVLIYK